MASSEQAENTGRLLNLIQLAMFRRGVVIGADEFVFTPQDIREAVRQLTEMGARVIWIDDPVQGRRHAKISGQMNGKKFAVSVQVLW